MKMFKIKAIRPKCGINKCNKLHYAKGYCRIHYSRIWSSRTGKPNMTPKILGSTCNPITRGACIFQPCKFRHYALGLCQKHYNLFRSVEKVDKKEEKGCLVPNCYFKHAAKGFCKFHYELMRSQADAFDIKNLINLEEEAG